MVEATARLIVRLRKLDAALEEMPTATLAQLYVRCEFSLRGNLNDLGLTPKAAADLGLNFLDAKAQARRMADEDLARYRKVVP